MFKLLFLMLILIVAGCSNHQMTGYNLKGSVGQTSYEEGSRSLFTGCSIDAHFDVKR